MLKLYTTNFDPCLYRFNKVCTRVSACTAWQNMSIQTTGPTLLDAARILQSEDIEKFSRRFPLRVARTLYTVTVRRRRGPVNYTFIYIGKFTPEITSIGSSMQVDQSTEESVSRNIYLYLHCGYSGGFQLRHEEVKMTCFKNNGQNYEIQVHSALKNWDWYT